MVSRLLSGLKYYLGGWIFASDEGDNVADPATGLTPKHKRIIQHDWELVSKNIKQNGVDLFIKFFKDFPYTQNFFEIFKGKTLESLKTNPKMRAHAATVMYSLTSLVDNLDDTACLLDLARKISRNHFQRKIGMDEYKILGTTLVGFLQEKLGNDFTDYHKEAWVTLYGTFCSVVADEIKQLQAENE